MGAFTLAIYTFAWTEQFNKGLCTIFFVIVWTEKFTQ